MIKVNYFPNLLRRKFSNNDYLTFVEVSQIPKTHYSAPEWYLLKFIYVFPEKNVSLNRLLRLPLHPKPQLF